MKSSILKLFKKVVFSLSIICFTFIVTSPALAEDAKPRPKDEYQAKYLDTDFYEWTKYKRVPKSGGGYVEIGDFLGTDPNEPSKGIIAYNQNGIQSYLRSDANYKWCDTDKNTLDHLDGTSINKDKYMVFNGDSFITRDMRGAFTFKFHSLDEEYGKMPKYLLYYNNSSVKVLSANYDNRDSYQVINDVNTAPADKVRAWTFTSLPQDPYYVKDGCVKIYDNMHGPVINWEDQGMLYDEENAIFNTNYSRRWGYYTNLEIYKCVPKSYSRIAYDIVIKSGFTLNIRNNAILDYGSTITIEEGGVLSVQGQFYNDGEIINRGTVVIQDNSAMSPFGDDVNGSLYNYGGDVVMMKNAKLYIQPGAKLSLTEGATLVNAGTVIVGGAMDITNSTLDNRDNGFVFLGYKVKRNVANIKDINAYDGPDINNGKVGQAFFKNYDYSSKEPTEYDIFKEVQNRATFLGKGAKIVNSGKINLAHCVISQVETVDYTKKKQGTVFSDYDNANTWLYNAKYQLNLVGRTTGKFDHVYNNVLVAVKANENKNANRWWVYDPYLTY